VSPHSLGFNSFALQRKKGRGFSRSVKRERRGDFHNDDVLEDFGTHKKGD
jgi:hypothetical protein